MCNWCCDRVYFLAELCIERCSEKSVSVGVCSHGGVGGDNDMSTVTKEHGDEMSTVTKEHGDDEMIKE